MVNTPETAGGNEESVDIGEWGTMGDVEPNYDRQENGDTIEQGASEQSRAEDADALLQKAKEVARSSKAEEEDDDEPVFDEKKIAELAAQKKEEDRKEKQKNLLRDAREEVEDDDRMGESATATERDGNRISALVEMIRNAENANDDPSGYKGGAVFSKVFAKFGQKDRLKTMMKHKQELQERYGISYDAYKPEELERKADVMINRGETPGYRNWDYATNFEKIKLLTSGENGEEITKALKQAGYNNLPKEMGDENFTMHEVGQIAKLAEEVYLNLENN